MAYDTAGLLADVAFKLQSNPRYTRSVRLDGLNRGIEDLILWASEDYDVREVQTPADPTGQFTYAMEWPLPNDLLYLASVSVEGWPLELISQTQFVATRGEQSDAQSADPRLYYVRAGRYLNVWPRPNQDKKWQIYGLFKPADMVNDTDAVPLDRAYSAAVVSYASWWCLQGQTDEVARIEMFLKDYLRQRAEAKFNKTQSTVHSVADNKPRH